jgi:hypothetical protein
MSEPEKMSGFCDWKTVDPDVDKLERERQQKLFERRVKRFERSFVYLKDEAEK